jgi:hypothetical protein
MSKHKKPQHGDDHQNAEHEKAKKPKLMHHDWRAWTAIALMLLAIVGYILSLDESLRPGDVEGPEVPMVAE